MNSLTECPCCGVRNKTVAERMVPRGDGLEVAVVLLCDKCVAAPGAFDKERCVALSFPCPRWSGESGDAGASGAAALGVQPLWRQCVKMLAIGILNRSPALGAARLSAALDARSKALVLTLLLEMSGVTGGRFREVIREVGWKSGDRPDGALGLLELINVGLGKDELSLLGYFCETRRVGKLNISCNRFGPRCGVQAAEILSHDQCEALDVSWNNIGVQGAGAIARCLHTSRALVHLNLASNNLGTAGAQLVALALADNRSLRSLSLGFNAILGRGALELSRALKVNRTLRVLDVRSNAIGPQGAFALADALRRNPVVEKIFLVDNDIGTEGAEEFAKFFRGSIGDLVECIRGARGGPSRPVPKAPKPAPRAKPPRPIAAEGGVIVMESKEQEAPRGD